VNAVAREPTDAGGRLSRKQDANGKGDGVGSLGAPTPFRFDVAFRHGLHLRPLILSMPYIGFVELDVNNPHWGSTWHSLVTSEGYQLRSFAGRREPEFRHFVSNAAGLWLNSDTLLHDSTATAVLHDAICQGKRLVVSLNPNELALMNDFLDPYGIEGTKVAVFTSDESTGHTRLVHVARARNPESFRDQELLREVDAVLIQQPQAIRFGGDASAVLTLPLDQGGVFDLESDFPANWTSPNITCVALGQGDHDGAVLAISGSIFHDPYIGPSGHAFPGITVNERFAENVLEWLTAPADRVSERAVSAYAFIDRIERSLVEYGQIMLGLQFANWWLDGVPKPVRDKCRKRRESERGRLPEAAYLDLSDIDRIMRANSSLFGLALGEDAWPGGLADVIDRLAELNEVRRRVMHPTKRYIGETDISLRELSLLRDLNERTIRILRNARERRRRTRDRRAD
jgi:hypothetical protein